MTRLFKTHFDKSVGTTLLRHIVLTERFGKQLQDMEALADTWSAFVHDLNSRG